MHYRNRAFGKRSILVDGYGYLALRPFQRRRRGRKLNFPGSEFKPRCTRERMTRQSGRSTPVWRVTRRFVAEAYAVRESLVKFSGVDFAEQASRAREIACASTKINYTHTHTRRAHNYPALLALGARGSLFNLSRSLFFYFHTK